jgi:hypothetical protein
MRETIEGVVYEAAMPPISRLFNISGNICASSDK